MKLIRLLFHEQIWLIIICLLTINPPALAESLTSANYVLSSTVLSNGGDGANSSQYNLIATIGTPYFMGKPEPQVSCPNLINLTSTYDTSTRTVSLSKIDIPLLSPIDGKETGEIAVFSAQLEQVSGVEDFKIKPNSLQFLSFSKAYDPSHARYSFNTGLFSNGGLLKTCVAVPQIIVIPPNTPIYTDPKHYLVTLRQLAVSPDTFHVESVDAANP